MTIEIYTIYILVYLVTLLFLESSKEQNMSISFS